MLLLSKWVYKAVARARMSVQRIYNTVTRIIGMLKGYRKLLLESVCVFNLKRKHECLYDQKACLKGIHGCYYD